MSQRKPEPLDVVKVDGQWLQYKGGTAFIRLQDNAELQLRLEDLELVRIFGTSVGNLPGRYPGESIPDQEVRRITWDRPGKDSFSLRMQVTVFGEYRRRN